MNLIKTPRPPLVLSSSLPLLPAAASTTSGSDGGCNAFAPATSVNQPTDSNKLSAAENHQQQQSMVMVIFRLRHSVECSSTMATSSSNSLIVCHYSKSRLPRCPLSHLNPHRWRRRRRLTSVVVEAIIRLQIVTIPLSNRRSSRRNDCVRWAS